MNYSGRVFVGFWFDELQLQSEKMNRLVEMRKAGELAQQKMRRLMRAFNVQSELNKPQQEQQEQRWLSHGDRLQLHCPEIEDMTYAFAARRGCPDEPKPQPGSGSRGLRLAATAAPLEHLTTGLTGIRDGVALACSPQDQPLVRNVFVLELDSLAAGTDQPQPLRFGHHFYLRLADDKKDRLYMRSEPPTIDGKFGPNNHNPVRLNLTRDCFSKWRAVHWDKNQRFETEGQPIAPCSRMVIEHVMTGKCLAAENLNWHYSLFGFECGVSVYTYSDVHRNETSECIWNMITEESIDRDKKTTVESIKSYA